MRLVDLDEIKSWYCPHSITEMRDWLQSLPEVDLADREKGEWVRMKTPAGYIVTVCSVCKRRSDWRFDYCPHCGARMGNILS